MPKSTPQTIQRCPHDNENPYTMVLNSLIRDESISPNCRWLLIYLLSHKDGWIINMNQVIKHVKAHIGRDKLYKVVNEAIESGYIMKEHIKSGNIHQSVKYYVSENPKFKKCLRNPDFQDTEIRDPENQYIKNKHQEEGTYKEVIINNPIDDTPSGGNAAAGNNNSHECLGKCEDLSPRQKAQLSKYPASVVEKAVAYCYHPSTKLRGPQARIKQLHAFCKEPEAYEEAFKQLNDPYRGKTFKERILYDFKHGSKYNGHEFAHDDSGACFIHPNGIHVYGIKWKEKDLETKWQELLNKLGIK